jgi:hypothetical protein
MSNLTSLVILAQQSEPPGGAVAIGLLLYFVCVAVSMVMGLMLLAFWVWMIVDCATKEPSEGNDKLIWILVILLTSWLGAAIYYFVRRPKRIATHGR